jgi:hypothetical protein
MPAPPARGRRPAVATAAVAAVAIATAATALAPLPLGGCSQQSPEEESCTTLCDFRRDCAGSAVETGACVDACVRWALGEADAGAGAGGGGDGGGGGGAGGGGGGPLATINEAPNRRVVRARRCAACVYDRPCSTSLDLCGDECQGVPGQ